MPTLPGPSEAHQPHRARAMAESFGANPERYDRARPRYPPAMITAIISASPGRRVLDVGCGTGIAARQFAGAGCTVLGVEVDPRMAAFARMTGVDVEVAAFEEWDAGGRTFDVISAGMTWHWIDPAIGPQRAAEALVPGGRLAVYWNAAEQPPELTEAIANVYQRVTPDTPFSAGGSAGGPAAAYAAFCERAADGIRDTALFSEPEQWRFDWDRTYTRAEWLDQVPTFGGHSLLEPDRLNALLDGIGAAIDAAGGTIPVRYTAMVVTATRS